MVAVGSLSLGVLGLSVHRIWNRVGLGARVANALPTWMVISMSWLITFVYVNLGWTFFAMDFHTATVWWGKVLHG